MEEERTLSLTTPISELESRILTETDPDALDDLVDLFNINLKKKDLLRIGKLNDLQDKITEQIGARIEKNSDQFSNKDLLDYFKTIQDTVSKTSVDLSDINVPTIQINQVNIDNDEKLSAESRKKVLDAVNSILKSTSDTSSLIKEEDSNIADAEYEVIEEEVDTVDY